MDDVITRLVVLPLHIRAMVAQDEDCGYSIYLNAALTHEQNKADFIHELRHIENDDFNNADDIIIVEKRAKNG